MVVLNTDVLRLPTVAQTGRVNLRMMTMSVSSSTMNFRRRNIVSRIVDAVSIPTIMGTTEERYISNMVALTDSVPVHAMTTITGRLKLINVARSATRGTAGGTVVERTLGSTNIPIPVFFEISRGGRCSRTMGTFANPFVIGPTSGSNDEKVFGVSSLFSDGLVRRTCACDGHCSEGNSIMIRRCVSNPRIDIRALAVSNVYRMVRVASGVAANTPRFIRVNRARPAELPSSLPREVTRITGTTGGTVNVAGKPSRARVVIARRKPGVIRLNTHLNNSYVAARLMPLSANISVIGYYVRVTLNRGPGVRTGFGGNSTVQCFGRRTNMMARVVNLRRTGYVSKIRRVNVMRNVNRAIARVSDDATQVKFIITRKDSTSRTTNVTRSTLSTVVVAFK